jgi:hypothetical protein
LAEAGQRQIAPLRSPQYRLYPGDKLHRVKRFVQIIIRPFLQGHRSFGRGANLGQQNNRRPIICSS